MSKLHDPEFRQRLEEAILENHGKGSPMTVREISVAFEVPIGTVATTMARLRNLGKLPPAQNRGRPTSTNPIEVLQDIIKNGKDSDRIAATRALQAITSNAAGDAGPPPPTTPDELSHELFSMLLAVPYDIAATAITKYQTHVESLPKVPIHAETAPEETPESS